MKKKIIRELHVGIAKFPPIDIQEENWHEHNVCVQFSAILSPVGPCNYCKNEHSEGFSHEALFQVAHL